MFNTYLYNNLNRSQILKDAIKRITPRRAEHELEPERCQTCGSVLQLKPETNKVTAAGNTETQQCSQSQPLLDERVSVLVQSEHSLKN